MARKVNSSLPSKDRQRQRAFSPEFERLEGRFSIGETFSLAAWSWGLNLPFLLGADSSTSELAVAGGLAPSNRPAVRARSPAPAWEGARMFLSPSSVGLASSENRIAAPSRPEPGPVAEARGLDRGLLDELLAGAFDEIPSSPPKQGHASFRDVAEGTSSQASTAVGAAPAPAAQPADLPVPRAQGAIYPLTFAGTGEGHLFPVGPDLQALPEVNLIRIKSSARETPDQSDHIIFRFTTTLAPVTIFYNTNNSTAIDGIDFTHLTGNITIPSGTFADLHVLPIDDLGNEDVYPQTHPESVWINIEDRPNDYTIGVASNGSGGIDENATSMVVTQRTSEHCPCECNCSKLHMGNAQAFLDGSTSISGSGGQPTFSGPTDLPGLDDSPGPVSGGVRLVNNSDAVQVQPILESVFTARAGDLPWALKPQLTWNYMQQPQASFDSHTGHSAGDSYLLSQQVNVAQGTTGVYPYQFDVFVQEQQTDTIFPLAQRQYGIASAVNWDADASFLAVGAGWSLAGWDRLVPYNVTLGDNSTQAGILLVYGAGGSRIYSKNLVTGAYISPPEDFGTLTSIVGGYVYTDTHQTKWNFNTSGYLNSVVDAHGLTLTYTYSSGKPSTLAAPNGGITTFSYDGSGLMSGIAFPGNRLMTLQHDGASNLTGITDVDGSLRTLSYSGHRLSNDLWLPRNTAYTYDSTTGVLTQINQGLSTIYRIKSANVQGLTNPALNADQAGIATVIDPLNKTTTYVFDAIGRMTKLQTPDGATQTWDRDLNHRATRYTDGIGRVTSFTYSRNDVAQVTLPDTHIYGYGYDPTFDYITRVQDTLGRVTSFSYNTTADPTTKTDALSHLTTYTWSNGLLQTITDPLGHTTTFQYDGNRRLQTVTDPLGDTTTFSYGSARVVQDPLLRRTTLVYDARDRLVSLQDAARGLSTTAYNATSDVTSQTDALGHQSNFGYDQRDWLTAVTEAAGTPVQRITTLAYDVAGNLTTRTDPRGNTTTMTYDTVGRMTTQTSPVGGVETYAYDLAGQMTTYTDALGHTTSYAYNPRGWVTQATDALSDLTTLAYDFEGNVTARQDALGNTTSFNYDNLNRPTLRIDALNKRTTVAYDDANNVTNVINARGFKTTYAYDVADRLTQVTTALGDKTTLVYDQADNLISVTNPLGFTTTYAYDALNRATQVTNPAGERTTLAFDAVSNLTALTNPRGYTTSYAYDQLDRLTQATQPGTLLSTVVYDPNDNVLARVDPLGNRTTFGYDTANRPTIRTDPLSHSVTLGYDLAGNITGRTDALSKRTTFAYDAINRLTGVTYPDFGVANTYYDKASNVTWRSDPMGHITAYAYDKRTRPTVVNDARGGLTTLSYDEVDNLTNVIDPVGNGSTFVYDALDRRTQAIDPLSKSATFAYDGGGRLTSTTDRNGRRRDFGYDKADRRTAETWLQSGSPVNLLTYTYDGDGNLVTAANSTSAYTMSYDPVDRLTSVQEPFAQILTYSYDNGSRRTLVQDSKGGVTTSFYDAAGNLTSRQFGGAGQTPLRFDLGYTNRDQLNAVTRYSDLAGTQKVGSSLATYDDNGRMTNLRHRDANDAVFANTTYSYDQGSRMTQVVYNSGTPVTYVYDETDELIAVQPGGSGGGQNYGYDLAGNRTMTGYSTGLGNELQADGTWTYTYDNEGNITAKTRATGESWTYGYDYRNQLVSAKQFSGGSTQMQATYTYDALASRLEKDVWTPSGGGSGGTITVTRFAYDGQGVWADLDGGNALKTRYLRGDTVDQLFASIASGGAASWYTTDRQNSIRDITNASGVVQDHLDYDGFGNATESVPGVAGRYRWTGREFDSETGLQYNHARYYAATVGRWTSQDQVGFAAGDINLYRYVGNSPTNAADPSGLAWRWYDFVSPGNVLAYETYRLWQANRESRRLDEKINNLPNNRFKPPVSTTPSFFQQAKEPYYEAFVGGSCNVAIGFGGALKEVGDIGHDVGSAAVTAVSLVGTYLPDSLRPNRWQGGSDVYVFDFHSHLFGGFDHAAKRGSTGQYWWRVQGEFWTLGLWGLGDSFGGALQTGDWSAFQQQSGSFLFSALLAKGIEAAAAPAEVRTPAGVRRNFNVYEVLSEQPIRGLSRGAHRTAGNNGLCRQLQADPQLSQLFNETLGSDVLAHMRSGAGRNLLNPPGTVWHHPFNNPGVVQLLRLGEHTNPLLQPVLHPGGIGGFGNFYGP